MTPRQRRELGVLIVLIELIALLAPIAAWLGAVLAVVFAAAWAFTERQTHSLLTGGLHRYHAPPLARAGDCVLAIARHGAAFVRSPSRRSAEDTLLALAFFALILGSVAILELKKHAPHLEDTALGLAIGIVAWHIALELPHEPDRRARYRGEVEGRGPNPWVFAGLLLFELGVFLVLEAANELPNNDFLRGLLTGIAAMGLTDAATLQSTLIAIVLRGRPLH